LPIEHLTLQIARELVRVARDRRREGLSDFEVCTRVEALICSATMTEAAARHLHEQLETLLPGQPIPQDQIEFSLRNVDFLVKAHNLVVNMRREQYSFASRFALGLHLFSAADQGSAIMLHDVTSYRASPIFDLGERTLDSLFENGDGDEMKTSLMQAGEALPGVREVCAAEMKWPVAMDACDRHRQAPG
jgi:hypothetical protein